MYSNLLKFYSNFTQIYSNSYSDEGGDARSNANVSIKTRLKEGVDKSGPSFVRPMGDMAVDEGLKLRITTPVKGNPIPEFKWTKDGKPITHDRVHAFSDGDLVSFSYQFWKKLKLF